MTVTADQVKEAVRDFSSGDHFYIYPRTDQRVPSVTTILSATDGKPYLVPWSARLAAEYCVLNWDELARVIALEGEQAAIKLAKEQAKLVRERKADAGTYVHAVVEALILWAAEPDHGDEIAMPTLPEHLEDVLYDDQPLADVVDWMVTGFLNFVSDFGPEFQAKEMTVFNMTLGVAGTLDMIIVLHGVAIGRGGKLIPAPGQSVCLCVDVKTGRNLDVTVPEQLSAYRKMEEALLPLGELIPMPATDAAAVLHLRPEHRGGYRLMVISGAKDARAWNRFRRAVELQAGRTEDKGKPGKVCYPLLPDGTMRSPWVADLDGEGYGRVPRALVKAAGDDLDLDTLASLTAEECLALSGIGDKSIPVIRTMLADHGLHLADEPPASPVPADGREAA